MSLAPIALFVYNRPFHTQRLIESLLQNPLASESELYIYSDAPKRPEAGPQVREVRDLIKSISGFKSVYIVEREHNFGLARSVIDGVSSILSRHGRIIVLEDDLIVAPGFLGYMNDALEKYADDSRIWQVSGYFFPVLIDAQEDAIFLPLTTSWGWGTWLRAWKWFDIDAMAYNELKAMPSKRKAFDLQGAYPYFSMLERQLRGEIDSWAVRWWLTVFIQHGLVVYPCQSLVENAGFDGSGVHCGHQVIDGGISQAQFSLRLPDKVVASETAYKAVIDYTKKTHTSSLWARIRKFSWWGS